MKATVVSFDCAQTLMAVDWQPAALMASCAQVAGIDCSDADAATYDRLLRARWFEFKALNLQRDSTKTDYFWKQLTFAWARECSFPSGCVDRILEIAEEKLFGSDSTVFQIYDDVIPCLEKLKLAGVRMAVTSNWDISLHKALRCFGLVDYFEVVIASMEEGVEKPDPRIFEILLDRLKVDAKDVMHVGDNPIDDYRGAKSVGIRGLIIDRDNRTDGNVYLRSLLELPNRIGL